MPARTFKFRLQTVLEYKQKREEEETRELGRLLEILANEERELASLKRFRLKRQQEMAEKSARGKLNVEELKMYHEQQRKLARDIAAAEIKVQQAQADVEIQRKKLMEARKEVKTYEKLKEKHHANYLTEVNLEEQKLIDEVASTKYNREKLL